MPFLLVTESYSQGEIGIEKYRKLSSKFASVKEKRAKHSPSFGNGQHIRILE